MRGVMRGVMPYRNTSVGLHLIEAPQDVGQRRPEADDLVVLVEDLLLQRGHSLAQRVVLALHHFVCNDPIGTKKKRVNNNESKLPPSQWERIIRAKYLLARLIP